MHFPYQSCLLLVPRATQPCNTEDITDNFLNQSDCVVAADKLKLHVWWLSSWLLRSGMAKMPSYSISTSGGDMHYSHFWATNMHCITPLKLISLYQIWLNMPSPFQSYWELKDGQVGSMVACICLESILHPPIKIQPLAVSRFKTIRQI